MKPVANRWAAFPMLRAAALFVGLSLLPGAAWAKPTPSASGAPPTYGLAGSLGVAGFYDDNVNRAPDTNASDALSDYGGTASLRGGPWFRIDSLRTTLDLELSLDGQFYATFSGLTHFVGRVDAYSNTYLWSGGELYIYAEAAKEEAHQQKLRNALTYYGRVELAQTINAGDPYPKFVFALRGWLDGQKADDRPEVGPSVFDLSGRTVGLLVSVSPWKAGSSFFGDALYVEVDHRSGTLVSSTSTPGPFATAATESVADSTFGNGFTAYRYTGITNTIEVGFNHGLGGDSSLVAIYQRVMVSASSNLNVTANFFRLSYGYNF